MKGFLNAIGCFAFLCLIGSIISPIPFATYVFWISLVVMFISVGLMDKF